MAEALSQIGPLAKRSILRIVRSPPIVLSGLIFPLFLYAFNTGGLKLATKLPGFPTDSIATFALPLTFAFCGIFAILVAGTQLGEDLRTGYAKRTALTPLRSSVLVIGQLSGVLAFAIAQALIFLAVGLAAGAKVQAGVGGALLIIGFAAMYAVSFGCVGLMVALLTRSGEAVQGLYPLMTSALFLSSVSLPRELIQTNWYKQLTTYNPVSYMIEAPRSLLLDGWQAKPLLLGVLVSVGIFISAIMVTAAQLRSGAVAR
jgi:ABC-2 type transport system permease protein